MNFFLGVMTTVGGVAAIWFFAEKVPQARVARFLRREAPHFFPGAACTIEGVADPELALKERVGYALRESNYTYDPEFTVHVNGRDLHLDFLVHLRNEKVLGVSVLYCESQYVPSKRLDGNARNFEIMARHDDFSAFLVVTNAAIKTGTELGLDVPHAKVIAVESVASHAAVYQSIKENVTNVEGLPRGRTQQCATADAETAARLPRG